MAAAVDQTLPDEVATKVSFRNCRDPNSNCPFQLDTGDHLALVVVCREIPSVTMCLARSNIPKT